MSVLNVPIIATVLKLISSHACRMYRCIVDIVSLDKVELPDWRVVLTFSSKEEDTAAFLPTEYPSLLLAGQLRALGEEYSRRSSLARKMTSCTPRHL